MHYSISFTITKTIRLLLVLLSFLCVINVFANYLKWVKGYDTAMGVIPLFDFDGEFNVPSLFSVGLILINALLLFLISRHTAVTPKEKKYWQVFSYVFIYLAFDEMSGMHERLGEYAHGLAPNLLPTDVSRFWIVPIGILLLLFVVYFYRFYWNLPAKTKMDFFVAGLVYVIGAVGIEMLGELYMWNHAQPDFTYGLLASLEELCEMIGMILFMRALLVYLQQLSKKSNFNLQFSVGSGRFE